MNDKPIETEKTDTTETETETTETETETVETPTGAEKTGERLIARLRGQVNEALERARERGESLLRDERIARAEARGAKALLGLVSGIRRRAESFEVSLRERTEPAKAAEATEPEAA